ncbi:hypothetical protein [Escherichia coli]
MTSRWPESQASFSGTESDAKTAAVVEQSLSRQALAARAGIPRAV